MLWRVSMSSSLNLVPKKTAVVLIDLQNGITGLPLAPHAGADVIARANRLTGELRAKGATVVYVRVAMSEILIRTVDAPMRDPNTPPPPAIASELVPELDRQPADLVITKRQWGAFYGTELDQQLRRRGIQTILIGGIATNFGVESTAREAFDRGYELVFVEDTMSTLSAEAHVFATEAIFPRMGRVRTTDAVLKASQA
jgi:nicotinamidase-related amidase